MAHREKWTTQSAPHTYRLGESQNEASRLTQTCVQRTGGGTSLALRNGIRVKVAAMTATTHNPSEEPCWVSRLRENFTSGSYGEELETGPAARSGTAPVPYPTGLPELVKPGARRFSVAGAPERRPGGTGSAGRAVA